MKHHIIAIVLLAVTTHLLVTSCGDDAFASTDFNYVFNSSYDGDHADDLAAELTVTETEDAGTMITVELTNTVEGESYAIHAHDAADDTTTPNGTVYDETPNVAILADMIIGNGGIASVTHKSTMSYSEITTSYEGFFVVHDPLQAINTVDASTFLVVGTFAR